ncbi:MAG: hypothetical protein OXU54_02210 [Gammaproteobacteria bacterium]|nr:hypothetical protein [Gammaproteobacteria bacterium]
MTQANMELLNALREAGASEESAQAAAQSVSAAGEGATKADLASLESRLIRWVTALVLATNGLLFAALRFTG